MILEWRGTHPYFKEDDSPQVLEINQLLSTMISEWRGTPPSLSKKRTIQRCLRPTKFLLQFPKEEEPHCLIKKTIWRRRGERGIPLHFELITRKMMVVQSYLRQTTFIRTKVSERKGNPPTPLLSLLLLVSIIHGHSNHMCLKNIK